MIQWQYLLRTQIEMFLYILHLAVTPHYYASITCLMVQSVYNERNIFKVFVYLV